MFLFVIATVQIAQPAEAADSNVISWKGSAAEAYVSTDDNGLHSDAYIFASDSARKDSGTVTNSLAYVNLYQYREEKVCDVDETGQEQCSNQFVNVLAFDGFAIIPDTQGFETKGLSRATLDASISGFDSVSNTTKTITIDGVWTGLGEPSSDNYVSKYHAADYVINGRASGLHRSAQIDGSINGEGISINLDPGSASANHGSLLDSRTGYIEISK